MPHFVVVGGGIAGLAAAHALSSPASPLGALPRVTLVEGSTRLGGKIHTERVDGFLVEAGADSFSTRREGALEMVEKLGLSGELQAPAGGRVLVLRGGRLRELPGGLHLVVPTSLGEVFRSPLLSARCKARVGLELLRRPGSRAPRTDDEAVGPFLRRHFGHQYVERIAGPLLGGIHATDPERLSLATAFPGLAALEARWGSLIRGARRERRGDGSPRVALAGGMGKLVEGLARRLGDAGVEILTGRPAVTLAAGGSRHWRLELAAGGALEADAVVLAAPPAATAALLDGGGESAASSGDPALPAGLRQIPVTSTATVSFAFRRVDVRHPLDALGLLVPAEEGLALGACTFSSSKFPGRAPEGTVLLRGYVGTHGDGALPAGDGELAARVLEELEGVLGLTGEPVLTRVHRFHAVNPQYVVGHRARVAALEELLPSGLALAGCAYHGVGIPDCIGSGRRAAQRAVAAVRHAVPNSTARSL